MNAKLIVISAPSGAGKTTIVRKLQELHPDWQFSVSCTTRPKRDYEKATEDYEFITAGEFSERIENRELLEYEEVHGYMYGTTRAAVDTARQNGIVLILEVDVNGALAIKRVYPDESATVFIFPPSLEVLRERLKKRGSDSQERIERRLKRAAMEMKKCHSFDIEVINSDIDQAVSEINEKLKQMNGGSNHVN